MKAGVAAIVMVMMLMIVSGARAEDGLGVGIIAGEPTGISVKKWLSRDTAIDAAAAWSFSENDSFQLHADYLIHNFGVLKTAGIDGRLPLYFGIGGRLKLQNNGNNNRRNDHDALLGVRIPFGIAYMFAKAPVDIFAEIVPILDLVPATDLDINGAIGVRFYFR
ncbi:MAG TPA: DUF3996 domain-containing protein [Dongiaceae bacterium]|nr:DUF3996 domain-containing protein [Dongiaceae bacterium]